jgi:hypothetical protein
MKADQAIRFLVAAALACWIAACGPSETQTASASEAVAAVDVASAPDPARAPARGIARPITTDTIIADLVESLEAGYASTESQIRRAGLGDVVDQIQRVDGLQAYDFAAEELVKEVYRRAEAHTSGQGERVLAHIYATAADEFPAFGQSQAFDRLRQVAAAAPIDPSAFRFAGAEQAARVVFPSALEAAVQELADVYSRGYLPELSRIAARAFGKPGHLERHLASAGTVEGALRSAFASHGPPPPVEEVARIMMRETAAHSAVMESASFRKALADLDPQAIDFGPEETEPLSRLAARQAELASHIEQTNQIRAVSTGTSSSGGVGLQESTQRYVDYTATSFEARADDAAGFAAGGSGGGGGGGGGIGGGGGSGSGSGSRSYKVESISHSRTVGRGPGIGAPPAVSRSFASAIRSARAARGVAAGGGIVGPTDVTVTGIAWVANPEDDRFGRIVVGSSGSQGVTQMAATRTLLADSALAAFDVLWGGHVGATSYRDGEILVLMSMDPFVQADPEASGKLEVALRALQTRAQTISDSDTAAQEAALVEFFKLREQAAQLPRRIVVHPSLHGRELAWSAARIDFWFNKLDQLRTEAEKASGTQAPATLFDFDPSGASTWQFYERDARIRFEPANDGLGRISVQSVAGNEKSDPRSHYTVSMFAFDDSEDADDPDGRELPELSGKVQPMLDWLATRHPDFVRLNDFSEAFSVLRWASASDVTPLIVDLDGASAPIAAPDRVVIGDGPRAR